MKKKCKHARRDTQELQQEFIVQPPVRWTVKWCIDCGAFKGYGDKRWRLPGERK